nr:MAG TPA: hypothetical protein [Caudoviricetes sp.]
MFCFLAKLQQKRNKTSPCLYITYRQGQQLN